MKRRNVLGLLLAAAVSTGMGVAQGAADAPLQARQITPDYYVIEGTSNGQSDVPNLSIYVTGEGVVLVDPWFAKDYERIVAAVKKVTDQPIRYVINTHFHSDHTGSNGGFMTAGVHLVAQESTRRHMVEHSLPGPQDITFRDELHLYLGGKEVVVRALGRGHTDGDAAVYFPEGRIVCLGDMMAGTRGVTNPVVDYANGGQLAPWPASLDRALAFDPAVVIPGHGSLTDKAGLQAHRDKIAAVGARLKVLTAEGKSKEAIRSALISEFDFKPINLRALDGLIAEASGASKGL